MHYRHSFSFLRQILNFSSFTYTNKNCLMSPLWRGNQSSTTLNTFTSVTNLLHRQIDSPYSGIHYIVIIFYNISPDFQSTCPTMDGMAIWVSVVHNNRYLWVTEVELVLYNLALLLLLSMSYLCVLSDFVSSLPIYVFFFFSIQSTS